MVSKDISGDLHGLGFGLRVSARVISSLKVRIEDPVDQMVNSARL